MEHRICFEVHGIARDEHGDPATAGLEIEVDLAVEVPYERLAASVDISNLLKATCLDGIAAPEDVRLITPKEYDKQYGDEEDISNG